MIAVESNMIYEILKYADIIFLCLFAVSGLLMAHRVFYHFYGYTPALSFPKARKNHSYAIVVPARYESDVIEGLLESIKNQDYPKSLIKTFVIVESPDDPTCIICSNYENVELFIRPDLNTQTKGGALKQFFSAMLENEYNFDAYFIFDADNILAPTFISEMNSSFDSGYKLCIGFRNGKNWNSSSVAASNAAFFISINSYQNKCRTRFFRTGLIMGTGFLIAHDVIEKFCGWTFETLTEDVELSFSAALRDIKVVFNERAMFFDEQPTSLRVSWKQRVRWLRGFHQTKYIRQKAFKKSIKEKNLGNFEISLFYIPIVFTITSIAIYIVFNVMLGAAAFFAGFGGYIPALFNALVVSLGTYMFCVIYFIVIVIGNLRHIDLKFSRAISAALMYPVFLSFFALSYFYCFFKKEVQWERINRE